jgi:hypothetical protein
MRKEGTRNPGAPDGESSSYISRKNTNRISVQQEEGKKSLSL